MIEALQFEFMRNALLAGLLISVACGIVGALVVVNRLVFIAGGVAHAAYGGIGLALFLGLAPLAGAGGFAIAAALVMGWLARKRRHRTDTVIGAVWAVGMALGVIFIDLTPGYVGDVMSYLFGSIMTVPRIDLYLMAGLDVLLIAAATTGYRYLQATAFDEEFAALRGVPVTAISIGLLAAASLTVVMTIQAVGLILVIALLTIPPFIAERFVRSLAGMMMLGTILAAVFTVAGLALSYRFNLSSGAVIILVAAAALIVVTVLDPLISRRV
jgi:zinc transport system permease protein